MTKISQIDSNEESDMISNIQIQGDPKLHPVVNKCSENATFEPHCQNNVNTEDPLHFMKSEELHVQNDIDDKMTQVPSTSKIICPFCDFSANCQSVLDDHIDEKHQFLKEFLQPC